MNTDTSFSGLGLADPLLRALADVGYTSPTPIQAKAIPVVLTGRDLLAAAQTGTGKTAGFTLPILQRLLDNPMQTRKPGRPRCLILTPTRELTAQVEESVKAYAKYTRIRSVLIFGGVSINPQIQALRQPVDILVATPGRLLDHVQQGTVDLSGVEIFVLDEADRMLDMGFIHDIRRVIAKLPAKRQNLLFSATFSPEIRSLAHGLLDNPAEVDVAPRNTASELVAQSAHLVPKTRKRALLSYLIGSRRWRCWSSPRPSTAPTAWPSSWARTASKRWPSTATRARGPAPGRCRASRTAACPCWWPPTSRRAVWTSTSCRTW